MTAINGSAKLENQLVLLSPRKGDNNVYQVKIFQNEGNRQKGNIENTANKWLKEQGEKIKVVSITQSSDGYYHILTILYKPIKKEPTYL